MNQTNLLSFYDVTIELKNLTKFTTQTKLYTDICDNYISNVAGVNNCITNMCVSLSNLTDSCISNYTTKFNAYIPDSNYQSLYNDIQGIFTDINVDKNETETLNIELELSNIIQQLTSDIYYEQSSHNAIDMVSYNNLLKDICVNSNYNKKKYNRDKNKLIYFHNNIIHNIQNI